MAEGKLSPEDAADLIDAFYTSASQDQDIPPTPPREAYESASATEYATDSVRDDLMSVGCSARRLGSFDYPSRSPMDKAFRLKMDAET